MNYLYTNAFCKGFENNEDAASIKFFELLFKNTKLDNFTITNDITKANILFEGCFGNSIRNIKKWDKKIFFSGESWNTDISNYDIIFKSSYDNNNIIDLSFCAIYILNNNFLTRLIQPKNINIIPPKFCCFCVSNGNCYPRNKMFELINSYKKVDSLGRFNNNVGTYIDVPYWSDEYLYILKQYKFIICFENSKYETYVTEKIVNAYLANIIPIYWGTNHVKNIFYEDSMIYLENENNIDCYKSALNKIIVLDNDDTKYLKFINQQGININYFNNNYSLDILKHKLNNIL